MTTPGTPTFDQVRVFLAVVEEGSLVGAARRLGRATSAVSYAVDNLETQLGLPLFRRGTTRRPQLTEAGNALLSEAKTLARNMDNLRAKAQGLLGGLEPEISLAVDVMFPTGRLVKVLQAFEAEFPTVSVRLHIEALGAVTQRLLNGEAHLAVSGPHLMSSEGLERIPLRGVPMIPVAAPGHLWRTCIRSPPGQPVITSSSC